MMKTILSYWSGFMTCAICIYLFANIGVSVPLNDGYTTYNNEAPTNWIEEEAIKITPNGIYIDVQGASISRYAPTGSMKPVLDEGANGIRIQVQTLKEVHVGDIVSFYKGTDLIVHRIIEKGTDEKGEYIITKGDNNIATDGKIRKIEYKLIGILY